MKRVYQHLINDHFHTNRQMVFLAGPRQVGKTWISLHTYQGDTLYYNWDDQETSALIRLGPKQIAAHAQLDPARPSLPLIIFDEIHKYSSWKRFLKGFFDLYHTRSHIMVTGSAKLNIYKKIGDSLMGRYFLHRIHPLSVAELLHTTLPKNETRPPKNIPQEQLQNLLQYGGFPEPLLKKDSRFYTNRNRMRKDQLFYEEIREMTQIHKIQGLETLASLLTGSVCGHLNQSKLASQINVSIPTIKRWLQTLESVYFSFHITPWSKNIKRSLLKEPKYYLWDWSQISDPGGRDENFIASHLLKAVHFWTDIGLGEYNLHYLRDKEKREVDFLITKDQSPYILVEVKTSTTTAISKSLHHFHKQTQAPHAFQISFAPDYVDLDLFTLKRPTIVPVSTFLSQLI